MKRAGTIDGLAVEYLPELYPLQDGDAGMSMWVCRVFEALEDVHHGNGDKQTLAVIEDWHDRYHDGLDDLVVDNALADDILRDEATLILSALKKIVMEVESHAAS